MGLIFFFVVPFKKIYGYHDHQKPATSSDVIVIIIIIIIIISKKKGKSEEGGGEITMQAEFARFGAELVGGCESRKAQVPP